MPTVHIKAASLRERHVRDEKTFLRAFSQDLRERGFRVDLPFTTQRNDDGLVITQEPPNRLASNNPKVWPLLQRVAGCDMAAMPQLLGVLLAENDDRAEVLQSLEVDMPADSNGNMPDYDEETGRGGAGRSPGLSEKVISGRQMVARLLCGKVLLLMGAREEGL